jgi:hypothetical protein
MFWRRHETDTSRYRFRLSAVDGSDKGAPMPVLLTGATTNWPYLQPRTDTTSAIAHQFAVYFSANSAVSQMVTWNSTLNTRFAGTTASNILKMVVDASYTSDSGTTPSGISIRYSSFRAGGTIRHELGHWVHDLALNRLQTSSCLDYSWSGTGAGGTHTTSSCEWGFAATNEALATFFATRSITSADLSAWWCATESGTPQDLCSNNIANKGTTDPDGDGVASAWVILDDTGAASTSHCAVGGASCPCGGSGQPACTDATFRSNYGFRIETNIARFLWDMVDTNNEASQDDSDLGVSDIVAMLVGMPCSASSADGNCNEPNPSPCTAASRDKYNAYDFSDLLVNPTSETTERALNCVSGAVD